MTVELVTELLAPFKIQTRVEALSILGEYSLQGIDEKTAFEQLEGINAGFGDLLAILISGNPIFVEKFNEGVSTGKTK